MSAGAGFLLAVLWFDLMHDVQVRGHASDSDLPEPVLASIAGYYARVTTGARPMNRLIALVMIGTIVAVVVEIANGLEPAWVPWVSLVLVAVPVGIAATRTVQAAVQLGTRRDDTRVQSRMARTILRDHVVCAVFIITLLALQLASAAR